MNQQTEQKILTLLRAKKTASQIQIELGLNSISAVYTIKYKHHEEFHTNKNLGRNSKGSSQKVRVAARVNPETKRKADEEAARTGATVCRVYSNVLDDWGCGDDR